MAHDLTVERAQEIVLRCPFRFWPWSVLRFRRRPHPHDRLRPL